MAEPSEEVVARVKEYVNEERGKALYGGLVSMGIIDVVNLLYSGGCDIEGGWQAAQKTVKKILGGFKLDGYGKRKSVVRFYKTRERIKFEVDSKEWDEFYKNYAAGAGKKVAAC